MNCRLRHSYIIRTLSNARVVACQIFDNLIACLYATKIKNKHKIP